MSEIPYKPTYIYLQFPKRTHPLLYNTRTMIWYRLNGGHVEAFESNQAILKACCDSAVRRDRVCLFLSQLCHDSFRDPGCE